MPKTIEIRITIPDGAQISIEEVDTSRPLEPAPPAEQIKTYWRQYLSDNGRKVYRAAARVEAIPETRRLVGGTVLQTTIRRPW